MDHPQRGLLELAAPLARDEADVARPDVAATAGARHQLPCPRDCPRAISHDAPGPVDLALDRMEPLDPSRDLRCHHCTSCYIMAQVRTYVKHLANPTA